MFKTLFFILPFLLTTEAFGKVEMRWLTVASLSLSDGKTSILFDAAWTRPSLKHWLNLAPFRSNEQLVEKVLIENQLEDLQAVFVSHSHFDHLVDAPMVAKKTGAIFYADESNERVARAYKDESIKTVLIQDQVPVQVGDFTITPLKRSHAKIMHLFYFLPGPVPEDFNFGFYDYHVGDTWFYLIQHPEGVILIDQSADPYLDLTAKHTAKVDVLIQGVANRRSDDQLFKGYLTRFQPKVYVPNHFDNFFFDVALKEEGLLPGIGLDPLLEGLRQHFPKVKTIVPKYGEKIELLGEPGPVQAPAIEANLEV